MLNDVGGLSLRWSLEVQPDEFINSFWNRRMSKAVKGNNEKMKTIN